MSDRQPAECFPPCEFIQDELRERGWDVAELAKWMLSGKALPKYGPGGRSSAEWLAEVQELVDGKRGVSHYVLKLQRAFGMSAQFWMNLETAWLSWCEEHDKSPLTGEVSRETG